jgi:hypothetical protein
VIVVCFPELSHPYVIQLHQLMRQRVIRSLIVCSLVWMGAAAFGCTSGVGGAGGGAGSLANSPPGFSAFQGPALWGNLVLLALSVGIFMSTIGLRK